MALTLLKFFFQIQDLESFQDIVIERSSMEKALRPSKSMLKRCSFHNFNPHSQILLLTYTPWGNLQRPINPPTFMSLGCGRQPEHPGECMESLGQRANSTSTVPEVRIGTQVLGTVRPWLHKDSNLVDEHTQTAYRFWGSGLQLYIKFVYPPTR